MRKEENIENIEKEDLCSKLQVHFIENTEAEKSVEDTASTDQISTDSSVKPEECSKRIKTTVRMMHRRQQTKANANIDMKI